MSVQYYCAILFVTSSFLKDLRPFVKVMNIKTNHPRPQDFLHNASDYRRKKYPGLVSVMSQENVNKWWDNKRSNRRYQIHHLSASQLKKKN